MDRRGRAVAAVVLVVLVLAAAAIFLDINGDVGDVDLEERYLAVDDYTGTMRIQTVVVGPTENTTFYVENDAGEFVANRSLLPERPSFEGPPRVLVDNETVTVREFQPAVTPNGSANRTIRAVTRRGSGVVANRTVVADVTYRSPDRYRYDYVEPPRPDLVTLTLDGDRATLYERGGEVGETTTARLGIETLGIRFADVVDGMTDRYRVERIGRASVMGRSASVLALTPTGNVSRPVDRLWVDDETGLPIRVRSNTTVGDRNVTTTVTYADMDYDTGLPEDAFDVDVASLPPARDGTGADDGDADAPPDVNVSYTEYGTLEAVTGAVDFAVLTPSTPAGLAFEGATVKSVEGNDSVRLRYSNDSAKAMLLQTRRLTRRGGPLGPGASNVTVGDVQGRYGELGGGVHVVRWSCGGYRFELSGTVGRPALLRMAASVPCGAA